MVPSSRTSAGAAPGSSEQSMTVGRRAGERERRVAAGTNSRRATTSASLGRPSNGRATKTAGVPARCRGRPCSGGPSRTGRAGGVRRRPRRRRPRRRGAVALARLLSDAPNPRCRARRPAVGSGQGEQGVHGGAGAGRSTHQRSTRVSTMARPRPARSERPASTALRGGPGAAVGHGDVETGGRRCPRRPACCRRRADGRGGRRCPRARSPRGGRRRQRSTSVSSWRIHATSCWRATAALSAGEGQVEGHGLVIDGRSNGVNHGFTSGRLEGWIARRTGDFAHPAAVHKLSRSEVLSGRHSAPREYQ